METKKHYLQGISAVVLSALLFTPSAITLAQNKAGAAEKSKEDSLSLNEDSLDESNARFKFKGMIKNLYTFHRTHSFYTQYSYLTSSKDLSSNLTRLRLSPEFQYKDNLIIKVDYDYELITSNYGKSGVFDNYWRSTMYNDIYHVVWEPYRDSIYYFRTKLHRAYLKFSVDHFTATIGRQQIRFGSGKLWNPLDILNPISPTFVEGSDDQKGADAIKLDFFPDDKTEISLIGDIKRSNDNIKHVNMRDCNYIMRIKTSIGDTDVAVLSGYVTRRPLAGFDFASILFDGMLRGSMIAALPGDPYLTQTNSLLTGITLLMEPDLFLYLKTEDLMDNLRYFIPGKNGKNPVYFQANVGYEYTFKAGVFFLIEYFYNQKAVNYNRDLKIAVISSQLEKLNQKTFRQLSNQFLTYNQHYVAIALGYEFHPLVRGDLFVIGDIQGRGIFVSPSLKINAAENLDLTLSVMGSVVLDRKISDFNEFYTRYLYSVSGTYIF